MKATGIICEFNPFHNGHKYLLDSVKNRLDADAVICVMSGNFVQRGMPAHWNKRLRAEAAVRCGADLVLELPVCYAVNSAREFAFGGMGLLKALSCVDTVAFGSECGDAALICRLAQQTAFENSDFQTRIRELLAEGISYPKAYAQALDYLCPGFSDGSNNVLGLEYMKQAIRMDFSAECFTIKREGCGHDDPLSSENFASGSALRSVFNSSVDINNIIDNIRNFVPPEVLELLTGTRCFDKDCEDRLFALVRYKIAEASTEELAQILEVSEGLENRMKKALIESDSLDELILNIKSKRFTYAKISRILMQLILGITKDNYRSVKEEGFSEALVLSANETGTKLLNELRTASKIRLITNVSKQLDEGPESSSLRLTIAANDIYSIISGKNIHNNSDYVCSPAVLGLK